MCVRFFKCFFVACFSCFFWEGAGIHFRDFYIYKYTSSDSIPTMQDNLPCTKALGNEYMTSNVGCFGTVLQFVYCLAANV